MALIKCPECGKEISDAAECCIHCGYPLQKTKADKEEKTLTSITYKLILDSFNSDEKLANKYLKDIAYYSNINLSNSEVNKYLNNIPCCVFYNLSLDQYHELAHKFINHGFSVHYEEDLDETPSKGINAIYIKTKAEKSPLVKCPSCGKSISSTAYDCPICGHSLIKRPQKSFGSQVGATIVGIILLLFICSLF